MREWPKRIHEFVPARIGREVLTDTDSLPQLLDVIWAAERPFLGGIFPQRLVPTRMEFDVPCKSRRMLGTGESEVLYAYPLR